MTFFTLIISMLDDPRPWVIAGLTLGGTAAVFFAFLWFFRVTRLIVRKNISCPEGGRQAIVEFMARVGELGPYREVRSCSLQQGEKGITCRKGCLTSLAVLEAPLIAISKEG